MATATLVGVRPIGLEELRTIPCPESEGRWTPVPHHQVVEHVSTALTDAGYGIEKMDLGLARADARLFGTAILKSNLVQGVSVAIGFRSSFDKSISLQWLLGSRVFICGNMSFHSEQVIARRHTTHGVVRFQEAICKAVSSIASFKEGEAVRIRRMINHEITDTEAEATLLRLYQDEGILSPRSLPVAVQEWREPQFHEFQDSKNSWRLMNAVTYALGPRFKSNPQVAAANTIRLSRLLEVPHESPATIPPA